jgi:hypothetical protein
MPCARSPPFFGFFSFGCFCCCCCCCAAFAPPAEGVAVGAPESGMAAAGSAAWLVEWTGCGADDMAGGAVDENGERGDDDDGLEATSEADTGANKRRWIRRGAESLALALRSIHVRLGRLEPCGVLAAAFFPLFRISPGFDSTRSIATSIACYNHVCEGPFGRSTSRRSSPRDQQLAALALAPGPASRSLLPRPGLASRRMLQGRHQI